MTVVKPIIVPVITSMLLASCATATVSENTGTKLAKSCSVEGATLDTKFPSGNVASCQGSDDNEFTVSLKPEDAPPINCSAWYAFRVTPDSAVTESQKIHINLNYETCGHRYWPKTSVDGISWDYLPKTDMKITEVNGVKQASITIELDDRPIFVAGQEIVVPGTYRSWIDGLTQSAQAETFLLGKSAEGRDIPALTIKAPGSTPKKHVVLVGRQHPPEVTGALALFPFVETLLADNPLAQKYRARFETIIVPILNPDGVEHGYWRHNTGSTDLNRDWGPFEQPETKLMDSLLTEIENNPDKQLSFFADFHSTRNDIFYTIPDEFPTTPPLAIKNWLGLLQERMPDYEVKRSANSNLTQANSKNYVYKRYGVPTVTYEMGDETDRELIVEVAREAAMALMETLLAHKDE
ncbi:M14 family metallopeptidase [Parasphingorhabdus sp.]|uniref:M14 family metallopeptidase n=1 Tax=Parasphingorhabdus sp. TaxID=2709688 RepID=UPI003262DAE0